ncbi:unnamed protein product [Adineta steineri]|uniref:Uncharacterized protein n=1 Tax=Adineta steineri TaxID=433720 RepID=A0A815YBE1_9BILA|nr:unnamed protein product [Adineta steineri]CAF1569358.1 unnamed protein product [Adineta steineri]
MFLTVSDQSSTALHILLHANLPYTIFWFIMEILLFTFKNFHLTYASNAFGNLMLNNALLIISIFYGLCCAIGFVFFLILQSYAQRLEMLLAGISLTLILIEILLSIITLIRNSRAMPVLTKDQKIARLNLAQKRFQTSVKTE